MGPDSTELSDTELHAFRPGIGCGNNRRLSGHLLLPGSDLLFLASPAKSEAENLSRVGHEAFH